MNESGPTEQGALSDATGTVDIVDWMGESLEESLEEDEHYVLKDVRVSTFNDAIQLEVVQGVTKVESIQQGVGHTALDEAAENQDLSTVADGGHETSSGETGNDHNSSTEDTSQDSGDDNTSRFGKDTTDEEESSS